LLSPALARIAALVGGVALALSPGYVIWAVSGLENPLFGLLVSALAAVLVRSVQRRSLADRGVIVCCAGLSLLLAATRPDGAVYFAAHPLLLVLLREDYGVVKALRALAMSVGAFGLPLVGLLLWRHSVFGLWLPNTAVAKGQGGIGADNLARLILLPDALDFAVTVPLCALFAGLVAYERRRALETGQSERLVRGVLGVLVPWFLSAMAFGILERDWMREYRFATPFIALGCALLGLGVGLLFERLPGSIRVRVLGVIAVSVLVSAQVVAMVPRTSDFRAWPTVPGCHVTERYGHTFNLYADRLGLERGSVLLPDVGGTLLTTRLRVVDYAGLVDAPIAQLRGSSEWEALRRHVLVDRRPTFIHVHGNWNNGLTQEKRFREDYAVIVPGQDFVRRDAVKDDSRLAALRTEAETLVHKIDQRYIGHPLRSCGALQQGQATAS
jgi:hypothetical protein